MNRKSFGNKLRLYRAKCGWSLIECAGKIGISPRYLADIERGDKIPKLETFVLMLNTLAASADDVLQDSLVIGYKAQSNDILKKLEKIDIAHRKQVLDIFESLLAVRGDGIK